MKKFRLAFAIASFLAASFSMSAKADSALLNIGNHDVVVNQVRLSYRVAGTSSPVPTIFLHGGPGQGSQSFATIAGPSLERTLQMVYLDQRGSGRSERPWNKQYSLSLLVDDLEQLRKHWSVDKVNLVGHSAGTIIAMEYAAKYPQHVHKMVLAASGPDLGEAFDLMCQRVAASNPTAYARAAAAREAGLRRRCNMWAPGVFEAGGMQRFVSGNMFPDIRIEKLINDADRANGLRNTGELSSALIEQGFLDYRFDDLARLMMPVLVIAGERDLQTAIEPQRSFVRKLSDGHMSEWKGAGHFMWAEDPARFAQEVTDFLKDEQARRAR